MGPQSDNIFDRLNLAASNLGALNPGAAARSLWSPASLSPEERKSISERILGPDPGALGKVLDITLNPAVLAGLVLTMRYPIARADRLFKYGERTTAYARKYGPGMRWLSTFWDSFGSPLDDVMQSVVRTNHHFQSLAAGEWTRMVEGYELTAGRAYDRGTGVRVAAMLDDLSNPEHSSWQFLKRYLGATPDSLKNGRSPLPNLKLMGGAELSLKEQAAEQFNRELDMVLGDVRSEERVLAALRKLGVEQHRIEKLTDYFPHIQLMTPEAAMRRHQEWLAGLTNPTENLTQAMHGAFSSEGMRIAAREMPETATVSRRMMRRRGWMLPLEDDLEELGGLPADLRKAYEAADLKAIAETGAPVPRYSLDLLRGAERYTHSLAKQYAWETPPRAISDVWRAVGDKTSAQIVQEELRKLEGVNPVKANMLKDTYIPLMVGRLDMDQAAASMMFSHQKDMAAEVVKRLPVSEEVRSSLLKPLEQGQSVTWHRLGGEISKYFYGSTLSFNLLSPVKNLFQVLSTTLPTIGPKYTWKGIEETMTRASRYVELRGKGLKSQPAFRSAFGEFWDTAMNIGERPWESLDEMIRMGEPGAHGLFKGKKAFEKVLDFGLLPFTGSERFNRISTFYGALLKGRADLVGAVHVNPITETAEILKRGSPQLQDAAMTFADRVVRTTQFGGGPLATPYGTAGWWSPLRQYTTFPLRMLGFAVGPALRMGGEGVLNPGTLGRALLASGIGYGALSGATGLDLSGAMFTGSMPTLPAGERPFAPFPLVSPFMQVLGSLGMAAASGSTDPLKRTLPLLLPGGVGLAKASTFISPEAARAAGKPYADYSSPTPDGRIPVYTANGQLIGYYSRGQMFAKAVGIGDLNGDQERNLMTYLLGQRDRIRDFRRRYTEALLTGDIRQSDGIRAEWRKTYPGLGDIPLKKSDVRAVQMRREIPRLERTLEMLPPELQPAFGAVVATSLGAQAGNFLGTDPSIWAGGSARVRSGMRPARPNITGLPTGLFSPPGESRQLATQLGEQRRDSPEAFEGFGGF